MTKSYGTIVLSIDGEYVSLSTGDPIMKLSGGVKEFSSNLDRSLHETFTPQPLTVELPGISATQVPIENILSYFKRCASDGEQISVMMHLSGQCSNDPGRYTFNDARVGGEIDLNARTGEISGVIIAASEVMLNGKVI